MPVLSLRLQRFVTAAIACATLLTGACSNSDASARQQREQMDRERLERQQRQQEETNRLVQDQLERERCLEWMHAMMTDMPEVAVLATCDNPNSTTRVRLRENGGTLAPRRNAPLPAPSTTNPPVRTAEQLGRMVKVSTRPETATLKIGETLTFELYATFENGDVGWQANEVEWRSVGGAVSVDATGKVTALQPGLSLITGTVPTHPTEWRASAQIRVQP